MTKLLITRRLPDANLEAARAAYDVTLNDREEPLSVEEARAALHDYDAILPTLGDGFSAPAFEDEPGRCKILANFGVGYNHIDVAAAKAAGLVVTNTPGAVTDATADIALTLMLMTCRRAGEGERLLRASKWTGWQPTQMLGLHMSGKVLGIVGMGRIGKAIAKRAHFGFGMEVVFFNRSAVADAGLPARQLGSLAEVCGAADIVVTAVPATPATHHLIGTAELAAMKPTAHLVNIARGDVVDETALITALETGLIAGAGLDVYEFEPKVPDALKAMENVVLLPHLGTAALEVRQSMGQMALDNLAAFVAGDPVPNPV
ncbi:D-glycerate dehydrogenase [Actibacterium sp. 188UL27-1]|uniref:2-hydroxyacid dehydrogenase n=1 Tax=Actibacterium sp. 188UL27-1 TaxID=2786961 RepID=UPI00195658EA|nr:D-glycerate dehydrogenase [Actibacterium sp. 188UL27-1]MBM7066512.1 D-glycerate dehydrogenase [Actibacterium sp. 188UL27-1]